MANYVSSHTGENIDTAIAWVLEDKDTALAGKADKGDVYTKSETYSKGEVNEALQDISATYVKVTNALIDGSLIPNSNVKAVLQTLGDKITTLRNLANEKEPQHLVVTLGVADGQNVADYSANEIANAATNKVVIAQVSETNRNNYNYFIPLTRVTYVQSDSLPSIQGQNVADFVLVQPGIRPNGSMTAKGITITVYRVYQDKKWEIAYNCSIAEYTDLQDLANYIENNYASLTNGRVSQSVLPESALNVVEGELNNGQFHPWDGQGIDDNPVSPMIGKIYVDVTANRMYRYSGSEFIRLQ